MSMSSQGFPLAAHLRCLHLSHSAMRPTMSLCTTIAAAAANRGQIANALCMYTKNEQLVSNAHYFHTWRFIWLCLARSRRQSNTSNEWEKWMKPKICCALGKEVKHHHPAKCRFPIHIHHTQWTKWLLLDIWHAPQALHQSLFTGKYLIK